MILSIAFRRRLFYRALSVSRCSFSFEIGVTLQMDENVNSHTRPWLTPEEQVNHLKSKGVRFDLMSESDAVAYLSKNNNYFRLRSYRTGFSKVDDGPRKGQYTRLDFKMLVDLSIVDMLLRYEMLPMTLDIEHFAKVHLLERIEAAEEDGYEIVADFLASYDRINREGAVSNATKDEIRKGLSSPYVAGIIGKYPSFDFPVWAFLELITFGTFIYFYKFCAERFDDKVMRDRFYILQNVKSLRNACAHNNCILNEMAGGKSMFRPQNSVSRAVGQIASIGQSQRKSKLSNDRLQQVATTLYVHSLVASEGVHKNRSISLHKFVERMNRHVDYYDGNYQVSSGFDFITKLVDSWFPIENSDLRENTLEVRGSEG